MAKEKKPTLLIEREYIVPLRREWLKVPKYKRANKAVKALKQFIARHMKVYDRDLRKIKIDIDLNNEIRFRGMRKPPAKIKVNAKKYEDFVKVELVNIPEHIKFKRLREEKKKTEISKKKEAKKGLMEKAKETMKKEEKPEAEEKIEEEKKVEVKEKEQASKEEGMKQAKQKTKEAKHISKDKGVKIRRVALAK